jgi:hypothetical protein
MALTPPANTEMATMQALDRVEERLGARVDKVELRLDARMTSLEERLGARIDRSELRTRIWTFAAIIAVQGAATGYLTSALR